MTRRINPRITLGKKEAEELLKRANMEPGHPKYKFFRAVLMSVFERTNTLNRAFISFGWILRDVSAMEGVSTEVADILREMGDMFLKLERPVDSIAIGGIAEAIGAHARRHKSNQNLIPSFDSVTDAQILEALGVGKTRELQADHLGISVRQLQRRLKKINST